jgi:hypothetical protein
MKANHLTDLDIQSIIIKGIDEITLKWILGSLTYIGRLSLKLFKYTQIGEFKLDGWKSKLPFYIVKCEEHGYQITYPFGHSQKLFCPICLEKSKEEP